MIEALLADGTDESLGVGVEIRTPCGESDDVDPGVFEKSAEGGREDRVPVEDAEALGREEPVDLIEEVSTALHHPPPAGLVDDAGHVVTDESHEREHLDSEEVGGRDGLPTRPEGGVPPSLLVPLRSGQGTFLCEDALDRGAADGPAQIVEGADEAGVAPTGIVTSDADDELTDLIGHSGVRVRASRCHRTCWR